MLQVRDKNTNRVVEVYSIRDDKNGFPQFLVYDKHSWKWVSAKNYVPVTSKTASGRRVVG